METKGAIKARKLAFRNGWVQRQLSSLMDGMTSLYATGENSDLTILCSGKEWKVHKFCLAAQSEFFRAAFRSDSSETKTGRMSLHEEDPRAVEAMIQYLYTLEYISTTTGLLSQIILDVRVYVLADKYLVPGLREWAAQSFNDNAFDLWFTPDFLAAVREVYRTTAANKTNPLKQSIVKVAMGYAGSLLRPFGDSKGFVLVLEDIAELGKDLSIALSRELARLHEGPADEFSNQQPAT